MQPRSDHARQPHARRKRAGAYHHGDLRVAAVSAARAALDRGEPLPPLRDLAATCGVSHPSLYRHFTNAEDLMLSVAAACFREFEEAIRQAVQGQRSPLARLQAGCETSIRWGLTHPARYALMMGPELAGKQHHAEFFSAARRSFESLTEAVLACGVRDPTPVAHTILCALHGLTDFMRKGRTIPGEAASVDDQIRAMCAMVLSYVRTVD
jgi:AcrR family transcriptional regulator